MTNTHTKVTDLTFEQALEELQTIVRDIELGKGDLDEVLKKYERGNELRMYCEKRLQEAKLRIDKVVKDSDNSVLLEEIKK